MRRMIVSLCVGLMLGSTAYAGEADAELMAPISKFIHSAYAGDAAAATAAFSNTPDSAIIDAFPPYLWHGPKALANWLATLDAVSKKEGLSDASVLLAKPIRAETRGAMGYVVVPAVFKVKIQGKAFEEPGLMTYVLGKSKGGWLIHSWTWTGPVPVPAQ